MDGLEADVAIYLTIDGQVFIAPQYDIKWEMNEGGSSPDFVALDFSCKEVVVVEVTGAANWKPLAQRVREREKRWFSPVRRKLTDAGVMTSAWNLRFLGFVREAALASISAEFSSAEDVMFSEVEKAIVPWMYWDTRMAHGLPGNRRTALIPHT